MKRSLRIIGIFLPAAVLLFLGGFGFYVSNYYHADDYALEVLAEGLKEEEIQQEKGCLYFPTYSLDADMQENIGLIFYPGGKVEYTAYVPLMKQLQEKGISCYLVKMPMNLAMFGYKQAGKIINEYPEIEEWYLGGHSLGGAFASRYASEHVEDIQGVVLLGAYIYGSYPMENTITIYGSEDQVLNREKVDYDVNIYELPGGNHGAFGNYGKQKGDGNLLISAEEQQEKTAELISNFVDQDDD